MTDAQGTNRAIYEIIRNGDVESLAQGLANKRWSQLVQDMVLLYAAKLGKAECFQCLLDHGVHIIRSADARSPLHLVLRNGGGNLAIVKAILAAYSTEHVRGLTQFVNKKDQRAFTPLYYAAKKGYDEVVLELVKAGAARDKNSLDGVTALMAAAEEGHVSTVDLLIKLGAGVNKMDLHKQYALMYAARMGQAKCMQRLLEAGCAVNRVSNLNQTSIMIAAKAGSIACVELLLEHGAALDTVDIYSRTVLSHAIESQNIPLVELLLKKFQLLKLVNTDWSVHMAVRKDHVQILDMLNVYGWDLKLRDSSERTLLHNAAAEGSLKCMRYILEGESRGVRLNVNDLCDYQSTPLHYACRRHHPEAVDFLLKHCVETRATDGGLYTPLLYSMSNSCKGLPQKYVIVKAILRYGCDVEQKGVAHPCKQSTGHEQLVGCYCQTPIEWAILMENPCLVEMLWAAGSLPGKATSWSSGNIPWSQSTTTTKIQRNLIIEMIKDQVCQPRSLAHICRTAIRSSIKVDIVRKVHELPLPQPVKLYLNLPELDHIEIKYQTAGEKFENGFGELDEVIDEFDSFSDSSELESLASEVYSGSQSTDSD